MSNGVRLRSRNYLRFTWSHRNAAHRAAVRAFNRLVRTVPFGVKYGVGAKLRRGNPPYALIRASDTIIQVGAPLDTLLSGRSRGMHFALLTKRTGRLLVVEPDARSAERFRSEALAQGLSHVVVHHGGAWSERTTLRIRIDDRHPATNFVEGCADYTDEEAKTFRVEEIEAVALDDLVDELGFDNVDVVSITTNGAELPILQGLERTLTKGVRYVCLARTSDLIAFQPYLEAFGYRFLSFDDRGFTFAGPALSA